MAKNQSSALDAPKLRIILLVSIVLLIGITAAIFWYFRSQLITYAEQVKKDTAAASISSNDVSRLKSLEQELKDNQVAVTRAKNIVADSQHYQYQNQIIEDIMTYGKKSGVTIAGFAFTSDSTGGSQAGAAAGTGQVAPSVLPAGLKTVSVSVSLKSPLEYQAIIKFIHYIEANLTKMQVSGVSLSKTAPGSTQVNVNPITLEVYIK